MSKAYCGRSVLREVSFGLRAGAVLALCGGSGSGKTTLVRIISGLVGFDTGTLRLNELQIAAGQSYPAALYGRIGVVFQDHNLFPHLTALQNVELALREVRGLSLQDSRQRALAELARMGVGERAQDYPGTLSGGERQRVALARAVAVDPILLLLDEPTASLEPAWIKEVQRCIQQLAQAGRTMLLITHNLSFARQTATSFALLSGGEVKTSDTPEIYDVLHVDAD